MMKDLKLLIVDDSEDNRLVLKTLCRKLEGFEIKEAVDGLEAVDMAGSWSPHIILMDIMMPNLDGFEASKIIKERHPDIVIIAVTAVNDSRVQENMRAIGVEIYIHKPVDRELIRYKLQSVGSSLRSKLGSMKALSPKNAINPFNTDIRCFKTIFEITGSEAMMDFGMWLFDQFNGKPASVTNRIDSVLEIFYKLMSQGGKDALLMNIVVEESYDEFYITIKLDTPLHLEQKTLELLNGLGTESRVEEKMVCVRLSKPGEALKEEKTLPVTEEVKAPVVQKTIKVTPVVEEKPEQPKEVRAINSHERELLHQSFVNKTSAVEYVSETGGDVIDEILDLASIDEEWVLQLREIEKSPSVASIANFADSVLNVYVKAINNLFEFTALAYALSSLAVFIKSSAETVSQDQEKVKMLIMMLEHLGTDLSSWREHIFVLQDTADIHYLDSSFFSSCVQIEGIISDKSVSDDDDNDMEFF